MDSSTSSVDIFKSKCFNEGERNKIISNQKEQWENSFTHIEDMFEKDESYAAKIALNTFKKENHTRILELGGGQGRDTLYFAKNNISIDTLDYSKTSIETISKKAKKLKLSDKVNGVHHDIRKPLPFEDNTFDACYSHMLYCMALTNKELEFLTSEIKRILKPGGLNIFTVRNIEDKHYGMGTHIMEDMYERGGFVVHFFSEDKVRRLSEGFQIVDIHQFEEGTLPRKLFYVSMMKKWA